MLKMQLRRNEVESRGTAPPQTWGGHRSGAQHRKKNLVVPLHFLALKILRAQPFVKMGARVSRVVWSGRQWKKMISEFLLSEVDKEFKSAFKSPGSRLSTMKLDSDLRYSQSTPRNPRAHLHS